MHLSKAVAMRRTVARVGKMDAKKHLDTQLNQLMSANILQCMCASSPAVTLPSRPRNPLQTCNSPAALPLAHAV